MAENSVITWMNASGYNGRFDYNGAIGSFNADGEKHLMNLNGSKEGYGTFDAYGNGNNWTYNPHFTDPSRASDLIALMTGAIAAIREELEASN